MKKILSILILCLVGGLCSISYADEPGPDDPPGEEPQRKLPKKQLPPTPGVYLDPSYSSSYIGYQYSSKNTCSYFTLPADVEYIDIEAENLDTHIIYTGSVWAENPTWYQAFPAGEYLITCTTDNGDIYEGDVYI